ncbi:MAG TPA: alpha/beta hydrolase [Desulfobacteraceae bacterium]|nr:alpha/beta hydrolase [Desulfobacteraceae bacterium]
MMTPFQASAGESVILLHGLARTARSMAVMETSLEAAGYHTVNLGYPSTEYPVETLAQNAIDDALSNCPQDNTVHFVTHSLGGILVRQYLSRQKIANLGRVVMLGPPNKGSQVVDKLKDVPGFKMINGPAGRQLGTDPASIPSRLGPAEFEVGVIAGTRSINLFLSTLLPGRDDGKVTVENTRLEGMADHIELPSTHPFMMKNKTVVHQTLHFLKHGRFDRTAD